MQMQDSTVAQNLGSVLSDAGKHVFAFIQTLTGKANAECCFRTFDDNADRNAKQFARKFNGSLKPIIGELRSLNDNGAGVFMVINEGGQSKDEITHVRAVFADTDGAPLDPLLCLKPHIVVESSPGKWHVYWLVNNDFPLDQFKAVQIAIAKKYGTDPAVNDLPRVMRLPGFNHCKASPFMVRIIKRAKELPKYSFESLVLGLGLEAEMNGSSTACAAAPSWVKGTGNLSNLKSAEYSQSDACRVADNCKQVANFRDTGGDSEPVWYASLGLVKHCFDGEKYAHEWSGKHPSYDQQQTQAKLAQWTFGPTTCDKFREINPKGCEGCSHSCTSPIQLGVTQDRQMLPPWLDEMNSLYAWIEADAAIYRRPYRDFITPDKFHNAHANQTQSVQTPNGPRDITVSRLWLRNTSRSQYKRVVTRPNEPEVTADNSLNDWAGFSVEPVAGDVEPFLSLYRHLFGGERYALLWLGHLIQHPGVKMFVALVVWSQAEGVGKNLLFEAVGSLFDRRHFKLIGQSEVDDDFCGWIPGSVFVLADEVRASKSDKSRDKLKLWQTATYLRTHDKGQPKREIENLMNQVFLSNHADGMFLSDQDRRFFVHEVKAGPLPEPLKQNFLLWRDNGGLRHLLNYLSALDLEDFEPKGRAPVTESKREMIEASRSDLERWALDIVSGNTPLGREIVTAEEMARRFQLEFPGTRVPPSVATVGKVLIRMGAYRKDNQVRLKDGRKVRALTIKRRDYWMDQPESAWREELEKPL